MITLRKFPQEHSVTVKHAYQAFLLYLPTQIDPIEGERVTCRGLKLTNSLGKQQLELSTRT